MTLELSQREAELLETLLSRFIVETKGEIYHTETASYKDILKHQQEDAVHLLERLTGSAAAA